MSTGILFSPAHNLMRQQHPTHLWVLVLSFEHDNLQYGNPVCIYAALRILIALEYTMSRMSLGLFFVNTILPHASVCPSIHTCSVAKTCILGSTSSGKNTTVFCSETGYVCLFVRLMTRSAIENTNKYSL
jgi:hypothetical protein